MSERFDNQFSALAHFCEDIRTEVSGQISLIGLFTGDVTVKEFPVTLSKCAVYLSIKTPMHNESRHYSIKLYATWETAPLYAVEIDQPAPNDSHHQELDGVTLNDPMSELVYTFFSSLVVVPKPGKIILKVTFRDHTYRAGVLRFMLALVSDASLDAPPAG